MYITMCQRCAEKLRATYYTDIVSAPHTGTCALCFQTDEPVTQYKVTAHRPLRHLPPRGQTTKDRRARYRGDWREGMNGEVTKP